MQPIEGLAASKPKLSQRPPQIASWRHLAGFLLIAASVAALGFLAQRASAQGLPGASTGELGRHSQAIRIYVGAMLMDWALLFYCWKGVRRQGGNVATLSGGRWTSWQSVAIDLGIALPFWLVWEGAAYGVRWLLGPSSAKSVDSLLPQSLLEILVWIATSITAGVCEELAFRGYVQRQLDALTGSMALAMLGQGLVFGLFHFYQGWRNVIVICILGVLFGALAAWRRNVRASIIVHAWSDVWSGWLKFVLSS